MPTEVQNVVLPPIQKFVPTPEKPPEDPAPRRSDEFGAALKAARKKSEKPDKTDASKPKSKETKTKAKDDADAKPAAKSPVKSASGKTPQAGQAGKPGKSKSSQQNSADDLDHEQTDVDAEDTDPAIAQEAAQPAAEGQTETTLIASRAKTTQQAKDDPDHPAHDEKDTSPTDPAVAAQLIQPVDRAKDQNPRQKNRQEDTTDPDEADAALSAVKSNGTASSVDQSANAAVQSSAAARSTEATTPPENAGQTKTHHAPTVSPLTLGDDADIAPKTLHAPVEKTPPADASAPTDPAAQIAQLPDAPDRDADSKTDKATLDLDPIARAVLESQGHPTQQTGNAPAAKSADLPPPPPEVQFAQSNHDKIVTGVQTQLLPHGGTMEIRLDPPELGALRVMVEMRDGVMSATFQTSNEEATQLLSHSLNQLKHVLESQGVNVERLQVQQAPKSEQSPTKDDPQQQQRNAADDHTARQEQQRKEMMRRMWRRVSGAGDPIDYLA